MAKINSYPFDSTIQDADAWIGTDSTNRSTKQYTAEAVAAYTIGGLISGGTINTLPIFTSTGLANSLIRQDSGGVIYIGPEENVRFTGTSVNAPFLIGTDLFITNISSNNAGIVTLNGNAIIGNEVTDTLVVNSVSTFNSAVDVNEDATFNRGATFNDNVLIQTATDVDNLKIVSTNTSSGGAPDIVLLADVPAVTGDSHGDILFQGQNGMVPGAGNILTYTGLFSKMFDKDNNHSSLVMTTHKGNGSGAQALTATFSAKGTNNAATGTLLINPSSVTEVASYNLEVKGDALVQDNLIVDANIGIGTTSPQRELDVAGDVRITGTLELLQKNSNTFVGTNAGNLPNTTGSSNVALGFESLKNNTGGSGNTALGRQALYSSTGNNNTGTGSLALFSNTTGLQNTGIGRQALQNVTVGVCNVGVGHISGALVDGGALNTAPDFSVFIGGGTKAKTNNDNNQIVIGHNAIGEGTNTARIGNTSVSQLHVGGNDAGIVLKSPNGTAYIIKVTNAGALTVTAL